jgi:hypothetical protein
VTRIDARHSQGALKAQWMNSHRNYTGTQAASARAGSTAVQPSPSAQGDDRRRDHAVCRIQF